MMKNKPVILVVDDQLQNIKLLEGLLVRQGYEIIQAESGEEALEKLSGNQVDLVLLDVKMPRMSGFEVLTKLRADKRTQRIPVVMITAHNENEARVKALESGCDDFISKPFDQYELLARVKSLLRIKFLNDEVDEAREFAESVINTVREPLISLDQDLRVVTVSRSFYEFFKVKPEETVGQLIYDLGNKQWDIPKLRELLETILPQKTTFDNYEVEHDFATIGRRIMLLNARQIQRGLGKERIILLAIEDITERKQLEDLLTESEMRYRRIFETASDGIVLIEKCEGHIVHANPAAEKMLGYSEEEYVGKMLQDIGVSLDMSDFPAIMQTLNKSGIINYDDVQVKTKSGHYIDTDIYMVDRAKLAQCNIRDITERKQAEKKLNSEKAFIENALNTLKDVFFVFDLKGRFLRWNKTLTDVSGYSNNEIALMKSVDLFRNDDITRISEAIQTAAKEGSVTVDAMLVTKDGRQIPYAIGASRLRVHDGNSIVVCGVGRDLTEHNKLEAQLRHSQKMEAVGTLAGGIAHDFNNILNVIMGYGTMVMDTLEAGSPSKEHMNEVLIAAERAENLTRRLLVFSSKQIVEVKPVNINELILGLQNMLVRIIRENIDINLDLADRPLIVLADAGQIEQVLINLATNAKDAMQEGGRLTISTGLEEVDDEYVTSYGYGKPGRYVLITVSDTGHGMDAETQKKIFEPFFTTKGIGEGTGLGLAISYGIIIQHGGYIKVYSEPGQGTLFKIHLPFSEEAASPDWKTEAAVPVMSGNETVLVAEDDASLRQLTRIILESFGYSVISAEDGEDAITKFMEDRERISLVLLDMIMPKKNGKEVSEAIRKVSPRIKILFTSGYTMDIIKTKELSEVGFDFIHKPFQPTDLLKKVREVLDR
jgi:PAS domain S-box-containing protein